MCIHTCPVVNSLLPQTPVHKQYVVQLAEAVIRIIVWRRYNVLAYTSTWGVVAISLIWQLWLVTFSSILQARHVNAFLRQRATSATAAAGTSSSAGQTAASLPASSSSSGTTSTKTCATSAAAAIVVEVSGVIETVSAPPSVNVVTGSHSSSDAAVVAPSAAARAAPGGGGGRLNSPATQLLRARYVCPVYHERSSLLQRCLPGTELNPRASGPLGGQRDSAGGLHRCRSGLLGRAGMNCCHVWVRTSGLELFGRCPWKGGAVPCSALACGIYSGD